MLPEMDLHDIKRRRVAVSETTGLPTQSRLGAFVRQQSAVDDTSTGLTKTIKGVIYPVRGKQDFSDEGSQPQTVWTLLTDYQQKIVNPYDCFDITFETTDIKPQDRIDDPEYPDIAFRVDYVMNAGSLNEHLEIVLEIIGKGEA